MLLSLPFHVLAFAFFQINTGEPSFHREKGHSHGCCHQGITGDVVPTSNTHKGTARGRQQLCLEESWLGEPQSATCPHILSCFSSEV